MKRLLGSAFAVALLAAGGAAVTPARAQNASTCAPVAPPGVPNGGVLAIAGGQVNGPVAVRCAMSVSAPRALYWGARTSSAWDIVGTRVVNGVQHTRTIASGQSVLANDGMPNGNTFMPFAGETLTVTIYANCTQGACVAEGMAGVGG